MIFSDETAFRYTRRKREGYYSYSDHFRRRYGPDYECAADGTVMPTKAKTINFKTLFDVLKSKDESVLEANRDMFDGKFRFLDG